MVYDVAIVGGGPAGCSAAVTAANRSLSTVLFDTGDFGLALRKSKRVKNYLGLPDQSGSADGRFRGPHESRQAGSGTP